MTIIVALSLISWAVVVTVLAVGIGLQHEDVIMFGVVLLVALIICCSSFEMGAFWQRLDTIEHYQLTKKVLP